MCSECLSGLVLDIDDRVWRTLRDGWSVPRFSKDRNIERMIGLRVPVQSTVDMAFGDVN